MIAESLSAEKAADLKISLEEIGVRTRKVDADRWAVLPRGFKVFALDFLEDAISARLLSGKKLVLPRDHIFGLHLYGLVPFAEAAEAPEEGVDPGDFWIDLPMDPDDGEVKSTAPQGGCQPISRRSSSSPSFDARLSPRGRALFENLSRDGLAAMQFCLTLYLRDPVGPVRIKKNEFDYSCLKEGRQEHSLDNFLLLLEAALDYLPNAWNRETVEEFLRSLNPQKILYFKEEEAENFDRWMLQWVKIEAEDGEGKGRAP